MKRTIAFGDLHLVRETPAEVIDDVVAVVREHAGERLAFVGDVFDLSADQPGVERGRALESAWEAQPRVRRALAEHVERGGELWLLGGNHDAALGQPELHTSTVASLGLDRPAAARVRSSPWFIRDGGLHLEHGHLFDPDNALEHPLSQAAHSLGVHFVERFIAPTGAYRYLNANDEMPLELLVSAFRWYGTRGPYVVFKYFDTAFRALLASGPFFPEDDSPESASTREARFVADHDVEPDLVASLRALGAEPTMTSLTATFQRLYLDRVSATLALTSGLAALASGRKRAAALLLGAGAAVMGASWALGYDRYGGSVPTLLERGAEAIRKASDAKLVVMGHAHQEADRPGYANTGSFAFPKGAPGRPYLVIEPGSHRATRGYYVRRDARTA
jgi:UDP-2,3-diacylglucosamine pyrophosphatase LpxH